MKLRKFNKKKEIKKLKFNKNKSRYIKFYTLIFLMFLLIFSVIYFTYSKFTFTDTFKTNEITIGKFIPADYSINYYLEGVLIKNIPNDANYDGVVSCNNGASAKWNGKTRTITIYNSTKTKTSCNVFLEPAAPAPELYTGLIPVTYDSSNNMVVADINSEWYNYLNHEWANAILIDQSNATTKDKYLNADGTYKSGTQVAISDVLQMYVWVPRYKYKLFNAEGNSGTTAQMIEVEFESKETAKSTGSTNGEWLTHPAFTFGNTELNGIWVSKFEPSNTTSDIKIIPNVSSLRNINVSSMFNASRAIETNAKYGLSSSEVDTHMMKNMEWGAVAYLTNSKYGRYIDSSTCIDSGCEVWINNNSQHTTGCAGNSVSEDSVEDNICNAWNTTKGVNASTTGNIYGIYDMNGGAWEYLMGNMSDSSGNFYPSKSEFTSAPESKYYDTYISSTLSGGKLGDATKETHGWNGDWFIFINEQKPWFARGGFNSDDTTSGIFNFGGDTGSSNGNATFRVVLTAE